ncbi:MAG: hypothetical protein V1818_00435 [Candidatus Aenigmatarchaeota archaeon]
MNNSMLLRTALQLTNAKIEIVSASTHERSADFRVYTKTKIPQSVITEIRMKEGIYLDTHPIKASRYPDCFKYSGVSVTRYSPLGNCEVLGD